MYLSFWKCNVSFCIKNILVLIKIIANEKIRTSTCNTDGSQVITKISNIHLHSWTVDPYTKPSWLTFSILQIWISFNLTKVRPPFTLSHSGSDNSPLLIVFSANYIDQSNCDFNATEGISEALTFWRFDLSTLHARGDTKT